MDKQLLKGHTSLLILASLEDGPKHGYLIARYLKGAFGDQFQFSAGMLYPALHSLEKKGHIHGSWEKDGRRKRRHYRLTPSGKAELKNQRSQWDAFASYMHSAIYD